MNCIDLYSGIGGWTLGMRLNGIEHVRSYEWNQESNLTHNYNFQTTTKEVDIRKLDFDQLPEPGTIDFVVGSPPCTQFSLSNRGGQGDIADGLIDMFQFLSVVEYLKPKYWAMENVPRVKNILIDILDNDPTFIKFKPLFEYIDIVDCSEYGTPQRRKRMIAGNFPNELFESYRHYTPRKSLGDVLNSLKEPVVVDPVYGYTLEKDEITDHILEKELSEEELRLNRESKNYHPVYNKMSFPEITSEASRTITSTCTRVSRESLVIADNEKYRRLTVRERAMLMGFPITYQFYGRTFNSKLKMIGNAIPPVVTYYLFQSMLEVEPSKLVLISEVKDYVHEIPGEPIPHTPPDIPKNKYRDTRSFRVAIPKFRFGSGVRFELSNGFKSNKNCEWKVKFYYGSSKKITSVEFSRDLIESILQLTEVNLTQEINEVICFAKSLSANELQSKWTHVSSDSEHPFTIIDELSKLGLKIRDKLSRINVSDETFTALFVTKLNQKLFDFKPLVLAGIILGHYFNENISK